MAAEPLQGHCPQCGAEELYRGFAGKVRCGNTLCEAPDAAHRLLTDPELGHHLVKVTEAHRGAQTVKGWTLRHPLVERLDDDLFTCGLHLWLAQSGVDDLDPGVYRIETVDGDPGLTFEPVHR